MTQSVISTVVVVAGGDPVPDVGRRVGGSTVTVSAEELTGGGGLPGCLLRRDALVAYVAADGVQGERCAALLGALLPVPVLTRADARAVGLALGALRYLRRTQRDVGRSRALVVGGREAGVLVPLLWTCGIADLSMWNLEDEHWLPLRTAVRDADVVFDLIGRTGPTGVDQDCADGSVLDGDRFDPDSTIAPALLGGLAEATYAPPGAPSVRLLREVVASVLADGGASCWPEILQTPRTAAVARRAIWGLLGD